MIRAVSQFNNNSHATSFQGSRLPAVKGKLAQANFIDTYSCIGGMTLTLVGSTLAGLNGKTIFQTAALGFFGMALGVLLGGMLGTFRK